MKKQEFLKKLEKKLSILNEEERQDILDEYSDHIDKKVYDGMTEEEAVKDFGDFDTLVKDILSAYKINENYDSGKNDKVDNTFNVIVDEMVCFFQRLVQTIGNKKGEDLLRIFCKIILILFSIWLLRIPVWIIEELGASIFEVFPGYLGNGLSVVWRVVIEVCYAIGSILMIYTFVKKMIFDEEDFEPLREKEQVYEAKVEEVNEEKSPRNFYDEKKSSNYSNMLVTPILIIIKFFVVLFTLPILCTWLGLAISLGIMIALFIKGIYLISLFFIIIGLLLMTSGIIGMIYRIVWKGNR